MRKAENMFRLLWHPITIYLDICKATEKWWVRILQSYIVHIVRITYWYTCIYSMLWIIEYIVFYPNIHVSAKKPLSCHYFWSILLENNKVKLDDRSRKLYHTWSRSSLVWLMIKNSLCGSLCKNIGLLNKLSWTGYIAQCQASTKPL